LRASGWASFRDWIRSSLPTATSVGTPGELLHIDIKKLGKINGAGHRVSGRRQSQNANRRQRRKGGPAGWEYVQVCVDDATRLAYAEVLPDEKAITAVGFLRRGDCLLRAPRHPYPARDDRQRRLLPLDRARCCLPSAGHPPRPHPALPAAPTARPNALETTGGATGRHDRH